MTAGNGLAALQGGLQIQSDRVAVLCRTIYNGLLAGAAGVFLDQQIHFGILHLGLGDMHADLLVVAQLDLGITVQQSGELQTFGAGGAGSDFGIAHGVQLLFLGDLFQSLGAALLGSLRIEELLAQLFLGLFTGDLTLFHALDLQLGLAQLIGGLQCHGKILRADGDGQLILTVVGLDTFQQLLVHL